MRYFAGECSLPCVGFLTDASDVDYWVVYSKFDVDVDIDVYLNVYIDVDLYVGLDWNCYDACVFVWRDL